MTQRRILLLLDHIESDYQIELISGVLRATRTSQVNTIVLPGGALSSEQAPNPRNFAYDLISPGAVDGILVMAGSLSNQVGIDALHAWLGRFGSTPVVCIGLEMAGRPSVFVDNEVGLYAAIKHLIVQHQRRKIGFLCGPTTSDEANHRYAAYCRALADHGLPVDPALVVRGGDLGREHGRSGVAKLLDSQRVSSGGIDALGCVNDDVALGALEALTEGGISVPDKIALVGFDDGPNARAANPPLTTVNQLVELQGYTAGRAMVEALESGVQAQSQRLDSREVIRASCGCRVPYQNNSQALDKAEARSVRSFTLAFLGRQSTLKADMARAAAGRMGNQSGWEEKVLRALSSDLEHADGTFPYALEGVARRAIAVGGSVDPCNDVLTALRIAVLGIAAPFPQERSRIEDMFQETRLTLTHVGLSAYRDRDRAASHHLRNISKTCLEALARGDAAALPGALSAHLPALGVTACTISRLSNSSQRKPELEVLARLSSDFGNIKAPVLPLSSLGIDQTLAHRAAVVLMPLDFNRQSIGLAGFAWGAHNPLIYEQLRELLSVALYSTLQARRAAAPPDAASRTPA